VVLVDTSVWIDYFQQADEAVEEELDKLLRTRQVATTGLVLAELRQGCRTAAQVQSILHAMQPLAYLDTERTEWLRAGELSAAGAMRGYRLEIGDCLLAATAMAAGCAVFTLDRDFERIPGLKLHRPRVT
jgi:predicted nucleic acid-binding protein